MEKEKKKFKFKMPHTYVILISIMVLMLILTHIIPAGEYDRVEDPVSGRMVVVADSYHEIDVDAPGIFDLFLALQAGYVDAANIMFLIIFAYGFVYVLTKNGTMDAALGTMVRKIGSRVWLLIPITMLVLGVLGSTMGIYEEVYGLFPVFVGIFMGLGYDAIVGGAIIFLGGVQRLAAVTEKLVPVMAALFILGGLVVLVLRIRYIPETFAMIFRYAFAPNAIIGGSLGYALKMAVSQGVKRGLFSNEAGMGSTPHAHAMAKVKHPHEQGVVAMTGVFIDTFVVLTMTALVVISTLYAGNGILSAGAAEGVSKANMAQLAFGTVLGSRAGSMFVAVCLLFFAFSTILSWNFFGRLNVSWLLGEKAVGVYSVLAIGFIFLGSCLSNDLVWELADLFNQLMVLPNVLALVTLGGLVAAACRRK